MNIEQLYSLYLRCNMVSTDTRNIPMKSMFFALKGANFNGNQFAEEAIKAGALFAIVDEKEYENESMDTYYVEDTLNALQKLAMYHRLKLNIPIIALTGSNGKTTTKELMTNVLSKRYNVLATEGNYNNHIGVPLTLLKINPNHEIAVIEMGANHLMEIDFLSNLIQPDFGYVTNFGKAHLEGFGGLEGVIKGKSELYNYLRENEKTVFVNSNDEKQVELTEGIKRICFGNNAEADYPIFFSDSLSGKCPSIVYEQTHIESPLIGEYNASNVAAAIAVGLTFEVDLEQIKEAIEEYEADNNRSQIIELENHKIILDAYNANPSSMEAALTNFQKLEGSKMVILGDMFELGDNTLEEHLIIAKKTQELGFDKILLVGQNFHQIDLNDQNNLLKFATREEVEEYLDSQTISEQTILIKGSRGMQLEKLLNHFPS
ncbi:UDP-N-acetylmuramoyl-tripeptide--D-alanyl-D-alanine ligase [Moheibacter stercoris]|uniref:UDP-N-acetylmuramoyl-tripeptide--D-alanyl-D-alanine ligase n=1 Tax=Moheibacter stercoris TaxID=1628251 RepID=A0ABV2LTL1_9FLAO